MQISRNLGEDTKLLGAVLRGGQYYYSIPNMLIWVHFIPYYDNLKQNSVLEWYLLVVVDWAVTSALSLFYFLANVCRFCYIQEWMGVNRSCLVLSLTSFLECSASSFFKEYFFFNYVDNQCKFISTQNPKWHQSMEDLQKQKRSQIVKKINNYSLFVRLFFEKKWNGLVTWWDKNYVELGGWMKLINKNKSVKMKHCIYFLSLDQFPQIKSQIPPKFVPYSTKLRIICCTWHPSQTIINSLQLSCGRAHLTIERDRKTSPKA